MDFNISFGSWNHVFPNFRNWIFASFLKWTNFKLSMSKLIMSEKQYILFADVFIPILVPLFLKSLNLNCLPVQIVCIIVCSIVEGKLSLFTILWNCVVWLKSMICSGVHFLQFLWIFMNETSKFSNLRHVRRALAKIERSFWWQSALREGISHIV